MGGMTLSGGPERPQYGMGQGCGLITALLLGLLLCLLMCSCGSQRQALMGGTVSADSAWLRVMQAAARHDSTVVRERVEIVPRLVRAGDTTTVRMDTTIVRLTERTVCNYYTVYADSGRASRDSVAVTYNTAAGGKTAGGRLDAIERGFVRGLLIAAAVWLLLAAVRIIRRLVSWKRGS